MLAAIDATRASAAAVGDSRRRRGRGDRPLVPVVPLAPENRTVLRRAALVPAALILAACSAASPSQAPGPTRDPNATVGPGGPVLEESAKGIAYSTKELTVTAGQAFSIHFRNEDPSSIPHDIDIWQDGASAPLQERPTIDGGKETTYVYEALAAGTYRFSCSIHPVPAMTGTLTAQ
jgi:plastocyanin